VEGVYVSGSKMGYQQLWNAPEVPSFRIVNFSSFLPYSFLLLHISACVRENVNNPTWSATSATKTTGTRSETAQTYKSNGLRLAIAKQGLQKKSN
jgi:hypothetical protein